MRRAPRAAVGSVPRDSPVSPSKNSKELMAGVIAGTTAKLHAPEINPFQLGAAVKEYTVGETLSINVTQGGLLLLLE